MSATVRKMIRRLGGYKAALGDEMRAISSRQHEKRERLRNAQLDLIRATQRRDEIAGGDRWHYVSGERRQRDLEEATEEMLDAQSDVADLEADLRVLEVRMEQLQEDARPASKLAELASQLSGVKHEDLPGALGVKGLPHVLETGRATR